MDNHFCPQERCIRSYLNLVLVLEGDMDPQQPQSGSASIHLLPISQTYSYPILLFTMCIPTKQEREFSANQTQQSNAALLPFPEDFRAIINRANLVIIEDNCLSHFVAQAMRRKSPERSRSSGTLAKKKSPCRRTHRSNSDTSLHGFSRWNNEPVTSKTDNTAARPTNNALARTPKSSDMLPKAPSRRDSSRNLFNAPKTPVRKSSIRNLTTTKEQ